MREFTISVSRAFAAVQTAEGRLPRGAVAAEMQQMCLQESDYHP